MHIKSIISLFKFLIPITFLGQIGCQQSDKINGAYIGSLKNNHVYLYLESPKGNTYSGVYKEQQHTYLIELTGESDTLSGIMRDSTSQILFDVKSWFKGDSLQMSFALQKPVSSKPFTLAFGKSNTEEIKRNIKTQKQSDTLTTGPKRNLDDKLLGRWYLDYTDSLGVEKKSMLSKGIQFNAQGTVHALAIDSTSSDNKPEWQILPGVLWYTNQNTIFLVVASEGGSRDIKLGDYLVNDRQMIIADPSGNKLIFNRHESK